MVKKSYKSGSGPDPARKNKSKPHPARSKKTGGKGVGTGNGSHEKRPLRDVDEDRVEGALAAATAHEERKIGQTCEPFRLTILLPTATLDLLDWCVRKWIDSGRGGRAVTRSFIVREAIRSYYVLLSRFFGGEMEGVESREVQTQLLDALWGSTPDANVRPRPDMEGGEQ